MPSHIQIKNASENNLKQISLDIPKNKLVVVTGVSGSGKSSLVYDVMYREAENRYLGTFSAHARQFMGKLKTPEVESIDGLSPAIAVNQKTVIRNPRSTVSTITGIYDYLRLLFARQGTCKIENPDFKIDRNLFSFNSPAGACPHCNGLGVEDRIDPELIVADENKSLREGAFVITAPNGYIIYSQVTMDVLDEVCHAEGFSADIPWKNLTQEQKDVVFYGSRKIEIPFGKHTLESRMKWSGITAKPRDTGYYKGVINVMAEILKRDRNKNILRFVRTEKCSACQGKRLNKIALSVSWQQKTIADLIAMQASELGHFLEKQSPVLKGNEIAESLILEIRKRITLIEKLGCGYLHLDRESTTLSGGESQRLRMVTQVSSQLQGVLYIFDEPSIGLHPTENHLMLEVLQSLRDNGNTVIVVEHDDEYLRFADHVIDIGPEAGINGGEVLINSAARELKNLFVPNSQTLDYFLGKEKFEINISQPATNNQILIEGAQAHNLKNVNTCFRLNALNVVTGVSGAGKSTLVETTLARFLKMKLHGSTAIPGRCRNISGWENIKKVVMIDQAPIGKTPRSNPATYTKLSDHIRDLFASLPESKSRGWKKGRFSFNVAGGRCEKCQGAGFLQVGMHFMGDVEIVCESCNGMRFNEETLSAKYQGKNIFEILEMSVSESLRFFSEEPTILRIVKSLKDLGLGYLKLGQRSTTLSGGEAQRVKLASELSRPAAAHTLYILDEPTVGLHNADVKVLLRSLAGLVSNGHTVIVIEHHPGVIAAANHIIDLGPGSGQAGGEVIFEGTPVQLLKDKHSLTGKTLNAYFNPIPEKSTKPKIISKPLSNISFKDVSTHNLQYIDVSIPHNKITVITGVSGSGKSSLAFDTLYAEGRNRFMESFSPYIRSQIGMQAKADFEEVKGITPVIAISRQLMKTGTRSTIGTMTGIYDLYRLFFSRIGVSKKQGEQPLSSLFSFNHQHGACQTCDGLGEITVADPEKLITHPELPIVDGAMKGHKWGKFYGDPFGQYIHTLHAAGERFNHDFSKAWNEINLEARKKVMFGTGDESYNVTWKYKRGKREGEHNFKGKWQGFVNLINDEYQRKHADSRGETMLVIMKKQVCPECNGARLNPKALDFKVLDKNISQLSALSVDDSLRWFSGFDAKLKHPDQVKITAQLREEVLQKLLSLQKLGLGYLEIDRQAETLSGGEAQRVRLASQLRNGLTNVTFVLDEPTVGLHASDTAKLIGVIRQLRDAGNTVVMVEHDRDMMFAADHMIELGPGAGANGGKLVACGKPAEIMRNPESISGKYLSENAHVFFEKKNRRKRTENSIHIQMAFANNLKNVNLEIPTQRMISLSGVSGSGKSTLMFKLIAASAKAGKAVGCKSIIGLDQFNKVVEVSQQAIATTKVSNALTYTGTFDFVRDLFAKTPEAREKSLKKTDFSFNNKGGRCENCQGQGKIRVSLDFVSDAWIICEECKGKRYQDTVLSCKLNGKNIFEVLEMPVSKAADFFGDQPKIAEPLHLLQEVGLGYLHLGQSTNTLSGGELQRLKLAKELMQTSKGKTLYLLDEPSTGLHFSDVEVLMKLLNKLVDEGNTMIIIEHNIDIIRHSDWLIDLGPGGGEQGGTIIAQGSPDEIIQSELSLTGKALK